MASNVIRVSFLADAKQLQSTFQQVDRDSRSLADKMNNVGKKLTTGVTLPIVGVGVAGFKMAADLEDAHGATEQIFGKSADDVKEWAKNLESYFGIAESEALESANIMGSLLQNLGGLSEAEAQKQSAMLVELAGDLTAMFGGTTQDAVRALTGALKGNNTMLDNYGIAANDASVKAEALAEGIWDGKGAMTQAEKQAATLSIIMKQTAAAQGQAAREAGGASGSMRAVATEVQNLVADIGSQLLPIGVQLLDWLKGAVEWFSNLSDSQKRVITVLAGVAAAVGPVLLVGAKLVNAIGTIGKAFKAMSAIMSANPYLLLIAATVALVTLIVTNWDKIKKGIAAAWDWLKDKGRAFRDWIVGVWEGIVSFFRGIPDKVSGALSNMWEGIKTGFKNALNWLIDKWNRFHIPAVKIAGVQVTPRVDFPDIPKLHGGGVFKAPFPGGEGLALLRDGERVLTKSQQATAGGSGVNIYVTSIDPTRAGDAVVQALQAYQRKHGALPLNVRVA